jgi:hypothetical protein
MTGGLGQIVEVMFSVGAGACGSKYIIFLYKQELMII